jgi:hypothetical protein
MSPIADKRTLAQVMNKAKRVTASLKEQFDAGRQGDDSPVTPVWPSAHDQLAALKRLFGAHSSPADRSDDELDDEAAEVAEALRGVDWTDVRAATAERTGDVARSMRSMADNVDWGKVQPVAAQVSSALIAAVASGRIPVGGPLGPLVARAIRDQNNLGRRVADNLHRTPANVPPDFRGAIEATATET